MGPTLYFLYDKLLKVALPVDVQLIAYVDDIAIVAQTSVIYKVGELLEKAAETVTNWLENIGIELAIQKTEIILFTRKKTHNTLEVVVKGQRIASAPSVMYLRVHLDSKMNLHAKAVTNRADKVTNSLRRIMLNTTGLKQRSTRLLTTVFWSHSELFYGYPIWVRRMSRGGWRIMEWCPETHTPKSCCCVPRSLE